jgi:asparagine synthase (glutamine-hydrolysing)
VIAGFCSPLSADDRGKVGSALAGLSHLSARWHLAGVASLADLEAPLPAFSAPTVLYGWLDNAAEIATALGLADQLPAPQLYHLAWQAWGDAVDHRIIGSYCAITALPGGGLRLVRSPWTAPPLHFVRGPGLVGASSVLRALFSAGHPRQIDYDYLADQLLLDHHDGEPRGWYQAMGRVPLGCRVTLTEAGADLTRYYDPTAIAEVRFDRDEDYLAAARELLDRAAAIALSHARRPGLMLSGGLDSALAGEALVRHLPDSARLPAFTCGPRDDWDGRIDPLWMGDERAHVRAFAAMHPRIEPHFPPSAGHDFDYRLRELFTACDVPTANIANVGIFHGAWEAARAAGCDVLLNADHGNFSISIEGAWYPSELLRRGRLLALIEAVRGETADKRPFWRKLLATAGLPLLPDAWRDTVRGWFNPLYRDRIALYSLLTPAAREAHARRRSARPLSSGYRRPRSRREWIMRAWHSADSGEDLDLGFERLYGIRRRDVTAWRPLIEFCMGLPTDQFVRGREHRRLARQLAKGRLPEAQRTEERIGIHFADWHLRMGERRAELIDYAERMRDHPALGGTLDINRMVDLLSDWPEEAPLGGHEIMPRWFAATRAMTAASFVGYAEGRNDL